MQKIYKWEKRPDYICEVTFFNGDIKQYNMKEMSGTWEMLIETFDRGEIDKSKDSITWPDGETVSADQLWYDGKLVGHFDIENPAVKLACKLLEARGALGISQRELEKRTGVRQAEISKIERAEGNPSLKTISKLFAGMSRVVDFDTSQRTVEAHPGIPVLASCAPYLNPGHIQGTFTTRDIDMLPEDVRVELIDGVLYDLAAPTTNHQIVAMEIWLGIRQFIDKNGGSCEAFIAPTGLYFDADDRNFLIPDVLVVCDKDKIHKKGIIGVPDFVLEVLSESTSARDLKVKKNLYEQKGVREYWIIDTIKSRLLLYDFENDDVEIHGFDEEVGVKIYDEKLRINLKKIADRLIV